MEQVPQKLPQISIVRLFLKSERPAVTQVRIELSRKSGTQDIDWSGHLFLTDSLIFLPLCRSPQSLPEVSFPFVGAIPCVLHPK
jgi:hypothetical protein